MNTIKVVRSLSVVLAVALVACGGDGTGVGNAARCGLLGTSNVRVTGSATVSINACAAYVVVPNSSGPPTFELILTGGSVTTPTHAINVGRPGPRPGNGTYNVGVTDGQWMGSLNIKGSPDDRFFILTGGTVTITTSNTGNLQGSVNMTAREGSGTGTNTVTISGTFAAKCVAGQTYDC